MAPLNTAYMPFYITARGEDLLDDADHDGDLVEELAEAIAGGADLRTKIQTATDNVAAPMLHGAAKRDWIAENTVEIAESGGDPEEAYRHYLQGKKDAYAHALEEDVVEEWLEAEEGEDDDEGEDGDDEEDDDDEDEDEDGTGGES